MAVSLSTLRTRCQGRADIPDDGSVSDAEWLEFINSAYFELYDLLVTRFEDYFESTSTSNTTVVDQEDYSLPSDFYKLLEVEVQDDQQADQWVSLQRLRPSDRNLLRNLDTYASYDYPTLRWYALKGTNLRILPPPAVAGRTIRIRYVPTLTPLAADGDTVVSGLLDQWAEFIVVRAVIHARNKTEEDVSAHERTLQSIQQRILTSAISRDTYQPARINCTRTYWDF